MRSSLNFSKRIWLGYARHEDYTNTETSGGSHTAPERKAFNKEDYICHNLQGQSSSKRAVLVKGKDSIRGQQFAIDGCKVPCYRTGNLIATVGSYLLA